MYYNVTICKNTITVNNVPVTRKEAKVIAENYSGAKIVKVCGPYHNGKPIVIEEVRQLGWVSISYRTGGYALVAQHEIEYK